MWRDGTCESNDIRVHYARTGGDGPPVILLHGLMGSGSGWTSLARALEGEFDVVMPDARGHGRSSAPLHGYSYDDLAGDVFGLVDGLQLSRPIVVGHSMGGMTAAVVAQRSTSNQHGASNLRGLVLVDPTFIDAERQQQVWDSDVAGQHRSALRMSRLELVADARARHPHRSGELVEIQVQARLDTSPNAFAVLEPPNPDFRTLVRAIEVPTLLVIGDSPVVSHELAAELSDINPLIAVEQIPHAGHGVPFDQPEQLARVTVAFLRRSASSLGE